MLTITIPLQEGVDENDKFVAIEGFDLQFEHSLVSLSKWESIWEKPFLGKDKKSTEETWSYIKAMCLTEDVPEKIWALVKNEHIEQINAYIDKNHTATWFNERGKPPTSRQTITSELVYYWMISLNIPFECQHWHLNRLITLIKVCNVQNAPTKKVGRKEAAERRRALNAERKARLNTKG